jgi:hypothetical protein
MYFHFICSIIDVVVGLLQDFRDENRWRYRTWNYERPARSSLIRRCYIKLEKIRYVFVRGCLAVPN